MQTPPIDHEERALAAALGRLIRRQSSEIENAIRLVRERPPVERRNRVSVLATVAHLNALLAAMTAKERSDHLARSGADGRERLDRLLAGELDRVAVEICDDVAGPYDVDWDGNWPSARPRLRGRIPASAAPGDVIVGGDGGGTRIDIRVTKDDDGVLTGAEVADTWRDPPLEEVWLATYRRLEALYPDEIPPPPGKPPPVG
jgi:hypothetical protein